MVDEFCEIYEFLVQRIDCKLAYELPKNSKNVSVIKKFFENSKIDTVDDLWKYLLFQIILSENKYSRRYSINLRRFTSLNAIKRWNERTKEKLFLVSKLQRDRGLRNPIEVKRHVYSEVYLNSQRRKYWNTPRGFILCGEFEGILYHKIKCTGCQYKEVCEKALNE